MSDSSTVQRSASSSDGRITPAQLNVRAIRCECQHCHAHTFLVLRTIGEAKCSVCDSFDLMPVED